MEKRLITAFFCLILVMGINAQTRLAAPNDPGALARSGQSEIIFNTQNADRDIAVWVNGAIAAHVRPKTQEKIIVSNGRNIVEAADTTTRNGQWNFGAKKQITVESASNQVTIGLNTRYGALLNLSIQNTVVLGGGTPTSRPAPAANSPEGAVHRAADTIIENIPEGATIAILNISSSDRDLAEFVIEELTFIMVDARKYKIVDRKNLDLIRAEQQFQLSGDVDDNSAVSIGKMLGASIVITGSITVTGSSRRLTARALDVTTAQIVSMGRSDF